MVVNALKEVAKEWDECEGNKRDGKGSEGCPEKESVPLPLPELT